jgi:hypothetical protein
MGPWLFATEDGTERNLTHTVWGRGQMGAKGTRGSRKDKEVCGNKQLPKQPNKTKSMGTPRGQSPCSEEGSVRGPNCLEKYIKGTSEEGFLHSFREETQGFHILNHTADNVHCVIPMSMSK